MKSRSKAREIAFKVLFAVDRGGSSIPDAFSLFQYEPPVVLEYSLRLVNGVFKYIDEIDKIIEGSLKNWEFDRISVPDKEILRLALFEIDYVDGIDDGVVVYETVEIAKKYGTDKSSNFINGILREILRGRKNEPKEI